MTTTISASALLIDAVVDSGLDRESAADFVTRMSDDVAELDLPDATALRLWIDDTDLVVIVKDTRGWETSRARFSGSHARRMFDLVVSDLIVASLA